MLCDCTETALRIRRECAKIALRIDSQWSHSQICQSVRAAYLRTQRREQVQFEPKSHDLGRRTNDAFTLSITLPTKDFHFIFFISSFTFTYPKKLAR